MGFLFRSKVTACRGSEEFTITISATDLEAQADLSFDKKTAIGHKTTTQGIFEICLCLTPIFLYFCGVGYMIDIARSLHVPMNHGLYMNIIVTPMVFMFIVSIIHPLVANLTFENSIRDLSQAQKKDKRELRKLEAYRTQAWVTIKYTWTSLLVLICVASILLFASHARENETRAQMTLDFNAKIEAPNALQNITSCIERNIPDHRATLFDFIRCWNELKLDIASTQNPFELTSSERL